MRIVVLLLALVAAPALAWQSCLNVSNGVATVCNLCPSYTVSKRGDDVLIRCPGMVDPVFTYRGCRGPTMQRSATSVIIRCAAFVGNV